MAMRLEVAAEAGQVEQAMSLHRATLLDPTLRANRPLLGSLVAVSLAAGRTSEILPLVEAALNETSKDPELLAYRGLLLESTDPAGAQSAFREALAVAPDDPAALRGLSRSRVRDGDIEGAIVLLDRALARSPRDERIAWEAIELVEALGDSAQLESRLRTRLHADPRDGAAALKLSKLLLDRNPAAALGLAQRAERLGITK
jgi:thioredoxin-like negative regulator of GroEL